MTNTQKYNYRLICLFMTGGCSVFIISICLFLKNMLPGQTEMLFFGDYINEYLPFFTHFWDAVFNRKSIEYSFSLGMGSPTMAMYSVFAFSPFSVLAYLIKDVTLAGYIMLMLKIFTIAVCMFFFLITDIKSKHLNAAIFSLFYSLSAYILIYYNNIHFMDVLYILPIQMHFLIKYVKEEKSTGLILSYAFSFINNFFNGFCTGVFSFIIYIFLLWYLEIRGKRLMKNLSGFIFAVFIAGLLSLPVLLPTVMYVLQHMPGGSDFSYTPLKSPLYNINSILFGRKIFSIFDTMPAVYCGWPAIVFSVFFFFDKIDKRKKVLAGVPVVIILLCIFWHPAYLFMHLFNEPDSFPWRFSFLLIFMFICIASYEYDHIERNRLSRKYLMIFAVMIIVFGLAYFRFKPTFEYYDYIPWYIFLVNIAFLCLHFFGDIKIAGFCIISLFELMLASYLQLPQTSSHTLVQQDIIDRKVKTDAIIDKVGNDDESFFRSNIFTSFSFDEPLLYDYPGMSFFCSFENSRLKNALGSLGLFSYPQQYNNYGYTELTNMLFSVKYTGNIYGDKIYKNSMYLPLAFSVSDEINRIMITDDPFENQQLFANSMIIQDKDIFIPVDVKVEAKENAEIIFDDNGGYTFRKTGDDSVGLWYLEDTDENQPTYLYIYSIAKNVLADNETIRSGYPVTARNPISVPIVHRFFTKEKDGTPTVYLYMNGENGSEVGIKRAVSERLDMDSLQAVYEELKPLGIIIETFGDDRIYGRVNADKDHSVLFSSIPYDINWHIKIDGKECDTYAVYNGAFLACDITPGEHEVEYTYKDSSLSIGLGTFVIGVLLLLLQAKNAYAAKQGEGNDAGNLEGIM